MQNQDWRVMENGRDIPTEAGYCDQPSIVRAVDGAWVCSVTTGKGGEGAKGQYVSITRSVDQGRTWSKPIPIEPIDWESAYSSLALAPSGRIFCFYCYNLEHIDISRVPLARYDMGGCYCYRYSEDCGKSWSARYVVPIRDFEIDEQQEERYKCFEGKPLRFFWNVSRVFFEGDTCYSALIKYHYRADDILYSSEGTLLRCEHLDAHPEDGDWETLPDGKIGLRSPQGGGRVAEEQSYVRLSDGTLFVTYRTIDGHPAYSLSRDNGHTFEAPRYLRYADGRLMKHNRAATFIWPLGEGKYLYWFNNQGLESYQRRNPIWCSLARECPSENGLTLRFSEPEVLLYQASEHVAMSYPDLLWDGQWFVTETQKVEARIHPISEEFLRRLADEHLSVDEQPLYVWQKGAAARLPEMVFSQGSHRAAGDHRVLCGQGYSLSLRIEDAQAGEVLLSSRTSDGGLKIALDETGCLTVWLGDVMAECSMGGSVPLCDGLAHDVVLILDSRANLMYSVVDGRMDDGGARSRSGWRWMNRSIIAIEGGAATCAQSLALFKVYARSLMTCEAAALRK